MKLILAITGASGSIYARIALERLRALIDRFEEVAVIVSKTAEEVWRHELPGIPLNTEPFRRFDPGSFFAPVASGSAGYEAMIVIPCSMGTLGRIAHGTSDDLIARAADVMLKERRRLVVVPREAPYNRIHLQNMLTLTDAGAVICPASPHFYHHPGTLEDLCDTVVVRALRLAGIPVEETGFKG